MTFYEDKHLEFRVYEMRSWAWQLAHIRTCRVHLRPGLRAFAHLTMMTMWEAAARGAFWNLERSTLEMIGAHLGVVLTKATTMFDCRWLLVKHILGLSDAETFRILEHRLKRLAQASRSSCSVLEVDEASACLHADDIKDLNKEKDHAINSKQELKTFKATFRAKKKETAPKTAKDKRALMGYKGPVVLKKLDHIPQAIGKTYMPNGAYLWRARSGNVWYGRYKDYPSRACADASVESEWHALLEVVRHAWEWFLCVHGLEQTDCPIKGLFDGVGTED